MSIEPTTSVSIAQVALKLSSHGLSIIPVASMETKAPALPAWRKYTQEIATQSEASHWFTANGTPAAPGMGIVCGRVSGGLTVIDFDTDSQGFTLYHDWSALVQGFAPGLLERLPLVNTPSGGFHVYFRSDTCEGNKKLAMAADHTVRIETRGEGGYVLSPPSPGYELLQARLSDIPRITQAERDVLLNAARCLDQTPIAAPRTLSPNEQMPGAVYNMRATLESVCTMLEGHGWRVLGSTWHNATLRRPGKKDGTSATVSMINNMPIFYSFSTNSHPLPSEKGVDPFGVYASLEHGGDFHKAAAALAGTTAGSTQAAAAPIVQVGHAPKYDWRSGCFTAAQLLAMDLPPMEWMVDDVIPCGLTLLAGSPKSGKSTLAWNIALAIASGGMALGDVQVKQRPVLYLMLEDGKRQAQARMRRMLHESADVSGLLLSEQWRNLSAGGVDDIVAYCEENPDAIVFVDTYESLRGNGIEGRDSYRNDYGALKPLADEVHRLNLNVVIVHHTNKRGGEDPFTTINGSNGISGVCDTLCVLHRRNDSEESIMYRRSREHEANGNLMLGFEQSTGTHTLLGDARDIGCNRQQQEIVAYLRSTGLPCSPKEIARAVGRESNAALWMQLGRMVDAGVLVKNDWGRYALPGGAHTPNTPNTSPAPGSDTGSLGAEDVQGSVRSVSIPDTEDPPEGDTEQKSAFRGIERAIQAVPCPSCSKMYTKKLVDGGQNHSRCMRCGVIIPVS